MDIQPIAYIYTAFKEKFGTPRQSSLATDLEGRIEFTPAYRQKDYIRGIEDFDYLWLIWGFSQVAAKQTKATVRPPRLGGNQRLGVFATRSPFRPNRLGLSSVRLDRIDWTQDKGPILYVKGVDMVTETPIYDIKPYSVEADSHSQAASGFVDQQAFEQLEVNFPEAELEKIPETKRPGAYQALSLDPRPAYQQHKEKRYGMRYYEQNIIFTVADGQLQVIEVQELSER